MRTLEETSLFELKQDVRKMQPVHTGFNAVSKLPTPIPESDYHKVAKSAHAANSLTNFKKHVPTLRVYHASDLNINFDEDLDSSIDIVRKLKKAGHDAYIVGGAIRDLCFGIEPTDVDISTSATPEQVQAVFKRRARIIGRRFIICLIHNFNGEEPYEVSTFRRDNEEETRFSLEYANVDLGDLIQYTGAITSTSQLKALLQQRNYTPETLAALGSIPDGEITTNFATVAQAAYNCTDELEFPQYEVSVPNEVDAPEVLPARTASQEVLNFLQTGSEYELDIPIAIATTSTSCATSPSITQETAAKSSVAISKDQEITPADNGSLNNVIQSLADEVTYTAAAGVLTKLSMSPVTAELAIQAPSSKAPNATESVPNDEVLPEYIPELDESLIASLVQEAETVTLSKSARRRLRQREAKLRRAQEAQEETLATRAPEATSSSEATATNQASAKTHAFTSELKKQEATAPAQTNPQEFIEIQKSSAPATPKAQPTPNAVQPATPTQPSPFAVRKVYIGNPTPATSASSIATTSTPASIASTISSNLEEVASATTQEQASISAQAIDTAVPAENQFEVMSSAQTKNPQITSNHSSVIATEKVHEQGVTPETPNTSSNTPSYVVYNKSPVELSVLQAHEVLAPQEDIHFNKKVQETSTAQVAPEDDAELINHLDQLYQNQQFEAQPGLIDTKLNEKLIKALEGSLVPAQVDTAYTQATKAHEPKFAGYAESPMEQVHRSRADLNKVPRAVRHLVKDMELTDAEKTQLEQMHTESDRLDNSIRDRLSNLVKLMALAEKVVPQKQGDGTTTTPPTLSPEEVQEIGEYLQRYKEQILAETPPVPKSVNADKPTSKKARERILKAQRRHAAMMGGIPLHHQLASQELDLGSMAERRQAMVNALESMQQSADPLTLRKALVNAFPELAPELDKEIQTLTERFQEEHPEFILDEQYRIDKEH